MTKKQIEHYIEGESTSTAVALAEPSNEQKSLLVRLAESELEQLIGTARRYPRDINRAIKAMHSMVTISQEMAAECTYALPRGGKSINGPSVRLAEIVVQAWGNCRVAARVIEVNRPERYVEAEGVYIDLESNTAVNTRVRRSISDK